MSRYWLGLMWLVASCASPPGDRDVRAERWYIAPIGQTDAGPSLEVADISGALATFMGPQGDGLVLLPRQLDRSSLDFSVESLAVIDDWLADIHTVNRLQAGEGAAGESLVLDRRGDNSVTFAGLYLGEVIRNNSQVGWTWQRFDVFLEADPQFAQYYGAEPGLDTVVLVGPQGVATPINTALKRVIVGKEESVAYIGQLLLTEVDLGEAMRGQNLHGLDRRQPSE